MVLLVPVVHLVHGAVGRAVITGTVVADSEEWTEVIVHSRRSHLSTYLPKHLACAGLNKMLVFICKSKVLNSIFKGFNLCLSLMAEIQTAVAAERFHYGEMRLFTVTDHCSYAIGLFDVPLLAAIQPARHKLGKLNRNMDLNEKKSI